LLQQSGRTLPAADDPAWLQAVVDALCELSSRDALTGLANRRHFEVAVAREIDRVARGGEPALLLMIDIDHFKRFNDCYGHAAGDDCLRQVAQVLLSSVSRASDQACRYGGEEFALLLPSTDLAGGQRVAKTVLAAMAKARLPHAASPTAPHVTVSIGVSALDENSDAWHRSAEESRFATIDSVMPRDLVHAADLALYAAKRAGRGRQDQQILSPSAARARSKARAAPRWRCRCEGHAANPRDGGG
jgi:diguanylate cyclase (GGDEF)-like protein